MLGLFGCTRKSKNTIHILKKYDLSFSKYNYYFMLKSYKLSNIMILTLLKERYDYFLEKFLYCAKSSRRIVNGKKKFFELLKKKKKILLTFLGLSNVQVLVTL